jgi:hypothetical protein
MSQAFPPSTPWFDDLPTLGSWPAPQAAAKLRELGEEQVAAAVEVAGAAATGPLTAGPARAGWWPFSDRPEPAWRHTAHAFGYLAPAPPGNRPLPIRHAGNIPADPTLKGGRVTVTLDQLRVAAYPGGGTHRVLFDFYARNQVQGDAEHLHFNATYRAREGERAAVVGYPIFVGLNVGQQGVAFKCFTVNVKNDEDEVLLSAMESDVFKAGLKLVGSLQPAVAPLSALAFALTRSVAGRRRNVPVQDFYLGLDFSDIATRARLALGSYLAVQVPEARARVWDWDQWVYQPSSGQVVNKADPEKLIPYNYLAFGVSRYEG